MTHDDHDYYAIRVKQEDEAARCATSAAARERHEELADAYRLRCEVLRGRLRNAMPDELPLKTYSRNWSGVSSAIHASYAAPAMVIA